MMKMVVGIIRMLRRDIIHSYKSENPQQSESSTFPKSLDMACRANINTGPETGAAVAMQLDLTHTGGAGGSDQ